MRLTSLRHVSSLSASQLALMHAVSSYNITQSKLDIVKLSGLNFTTAFPSHDHGTGVPKAAVAEFAQSLQ